MPGTFRPHYAPTRQDRERATEQARGSAHARGYDARWARASKAFLNRAVLCPACYVAGYTCLATVTDHIKPHKGDRSLFWDRANWQAACGWHHNVVKQRLEAIFFAGRIDAASLILTSPYALRLAERLRGVAREASRAPGGG